MPPKKTKNSKKKSKLRDQGAQLFDDYYRALYRERWDDLKSALLQKRSHVILKNPFTTKSLPSVTPFYQLENIYESKERITPSSTESDDLMPFYFMDGASAFAAFALDVKPGHQVLDLCAAPGGKALILAYALKGVGKLVANDKSTDRRLRLLSVLKSSLPQSVFESLIKVTGNDASRWCLFERECYDRILLDAPCSSESHVLNSPAHLGDWRLNRTKKLSMNQWTMLASAWLVLRPGGKLVYSTCSISGLENDQVVEKLFKKFSEEATNMTPAFPVGEKTQFGHIILPDQGGLGPIYLSVIEKKKTQIPS